VPAWSGKVPGVVMLESGENLGFGRANNLGVAQTGRHFSCSSTAIRCCSKIHPRTSCGSCKTIPGWRRRSRGDAHGRHASAEDLRDAASVRVMLNQSLLLARLFPRSRFFAGLYVECEWAREAQVDGFPGCAC